MSSAVRVAFKTSNFLQVNKEVDLDVQRQYIIILRLYSCSCKASLKKINIYINITILTLKNNLTYKIK